MAEFYDDLRVEKYVIMPNHIHFLICVLGDFAPDKNGVSTNSSVSKFVGTFKLFVTEHMERTYGKADLMTMLFGAKRITGKFGNISKRIR